MDKNDIELLLLETEGLMLNDIARDFEYYNNRVGKPIELDVFNFLNEANINTKLNFKIEFVSGPKFPDIVVDDIFGIEVKSTKRNTYKAGGNSIFERNRIPTVKFIYVFFIKLVKDNVDIIFKPYEDCISSVSVQHTLSYKYNLDLNARKGLFDKLGTSYDNIRILEQPNVAIDNYIGELKKIKKIIH